MVHDDLKQTDFLYEPAAESEWAEELVPGTVNEECEEKARHDRIVALVERMLRLHQELLEPLLPEEDENRLREIAATDAEIDSLVSDLYGLTAEEILILEESGSHRSIPLLKHSASP
jgi:hypothetical protein